MAEKKLESWDLPSPPPAGDQVSLPLYAAVGLALTMWEMLEMLLATFYTLLTSEQDGEAFIVNFRIDGTAGFRKRAELIEKAFRAYVAGKPNKEHEEEFDGLLHRARQLSVRRNDVGHGMVVDSRGWTPAGPKGFLLVPPWANYRKWRGAPPNKMPNFQLNSQQVIAFAEAFVDLRHEVERLQEAMFGKDHPWIVDAPPGGITSRSGMPGFISSSAQ